MPGQCIGCQPALGGCFQLRCQPLVQLAMAKTTRYHVHQDEQEQIHTVLKAQMEAVKWGGMPSTGC